MGISTITMKLKIYCLWHHGGFLFFHAFIEGIPLANETEVLSPYLTGICFITFLFPLFWERICLVRGHQSVIRGVSLVFLLLASPLGVLLGKYIPMEWQSYFLAIVGGIFLHISAVIIFESNKNHKMDWTKLLLVVSGILIAARAFIPSSLKTKSD